MKPMIRLRKALSEEKQTPSTTGRISATADLGTSPAGQRPLDARYGSLRVLQAAERRDSKRGVSPLYESGQIRAMLSARNVTSHERDWAGLGESMAPPGTRKTIADWLHHASMNLPRFTAVDNNSGANQWRDYSVSKLLGRSAKPKPFMFHMAYWSRGRVPDIEMPQQGDDLINRGLQKKGYYHNTNSTNVGEIGHVRGFSSPAKSLSERLESSQDFARAIDVHWSYPLFRVVKSNKSFIGIDNAPTAHNILENAYSPGTVARWHQSLPEGEFDKIFSPEHYGIHPDTPSPTLRDLETAQDVANSALSQHGDSKYEKHVPANLMEEIHPAFKYLADQPWGASRHTLLSPNSNPFMIREDMRYSNKAPLHSLPEDATYYDQIKTLLEYGKKEVLRRANAGHAKAETWDDLSGTHNHYEELQSDYHQHPSWGRLTQEERNAMGQYKVAHDTLQQAHSDLRDAVSALMHGTRRPEKVDAVRGDVGHQVSLFLGSETIPSSGISQFQQNVIATVNKALAETLQSAYGRYGINPSPMLLHGSFGDNRDQEKDSRRLSKISGGLAADLEIKYGKYKQGVERGLQELSLSDSDQAHSGNSLSLQRAIALHASNAVKNKYDGQNFDLVGLGGRINDHLQALNNYANAPHGNDGEAKSRIGNLLFLTGSSAYRSLYRRQHEAMNLSNMVTRSDSEALQHGADQGYWARIDSDVHMHLPQDIHDIATQVPAYVAGPDSWQNDRGLFNHGNLGLMPNELASLITSAIDGANAKINLQSPEGRAAFRESMLSMFKPYIEKGPQHSNVGADNDEFQRVYESQSLTSNPNTPNSQSVRRRFVNDLIGHLLDIHDASQKIKDTRLQNDAKIYESNQQTPRGVVVPISERTPEDKADPDRYNEFKSHLAYERPLKDRYAEALVLQAIKHAIDNGASSASFGTGFLKNGDYNIEAKDPKSFWRTHYDGRVRNMVRKVASAFGAQYHDAPWFYGTTVPLIRITPEMAEWFKRNGTHVFDNGLPDQIQSLSKAVFLARRIILLKAIG